MADSRPLISPILQMLFFAQPNSLRMNTQQPSLRVAAGRKTQGLSCAPEKQTSVSGRENGTDGVHNHPTLLPKSPASKYSRPFEHQRYTGYHQATAIWPSCRPSPKKEGAKKTNLHLRLAYIGFILAFASSIHNKQTNNKRSLCLTTNSRFIDY
jgi:hypothetical protein